MSKNIIAVAAAHDEEVMQAVCGAVKRGLADFILVGNKSKILDIAKKNTLELNCCEILDTDERDCARVAVKLVSDGKAQILMKGLLQTADLLRAVLNKEEGLRTGKTLSHVSVLHTKDGRDIFVSDAAMVMYPDLKQKVDIITNIVAAANAMGIKMPKVAILAAIENINPDMQATLDAAAITMMSQRGQIKNCLIDGPLAFDNAISEYAAHHKGIKSPIQGDADILIVPNIESGNVLVKTAVYLGECLFGGFIWGAKAPIVLTSRADTKESKIFSIECAVRASNKN